MKQNLGRLVVLFGLCCLAAACGPRPPSEAEIKQAYAARTRPVQRSDGTVLPVFKGQISAARSADCDYGYNGYFTCPVTISDREPNGQRDSHRKALVMIEWADGWQIREVQ